MKKIGIILFMILLPFVLVSCNNANSEDNTINTNNITNNQDIKMETNDTKNYIREEDTKTFDVNENVTIEKVSFKNRFGIEVVGDLYYPKDLDKTQKHSAIIVGHPYTGVKEQSGGFYANELASRGFVALAIDLSFNGESGGEPRKISSPEHYIEDFSAAVDFIGTRDYIDREKIGVIGICGSGGFAVNAAIFDTRIKAIATISMYDMGENKRNGLNNIYTDEQRQKILDEVGRHRFEEFLGGETHYSTNTENEITSPELVAAGAEFAEYYGKPRGQHTDADGRITTNSLPSLMNFLPFAQIEYLSPRPILFIAGENAHSKYYSDEAYEKAIQPKELYIVEGAGHVDLYDKKEFIPFDKLEEFFNENL